MIMSNFIKKVGAIFTQINQKIKTKGEFFIHINSC